MLAMDALAYFDHSTTGRQFESHTMLREVNKARVAFTAAGSVRGVQLEPPFVCPAATAVASGNWGCGAFGACPARELVGGYTVIVCPLPSPEFWFGLGGYSL